MPVPSTATSVGSAPTRIVRPTARVSRLTGRTQPSSSLVTQTLSSPGPTPSPSGCLPTMICRTSPVPESMRATEDLLAGLTLHQQLATQTIPSSSTAMSLGSWPTWRMVLTGRRPLGSITETSFELAFATQIRPAPAATATG